MKCEIKLAKQHPNGYMHMGPFKVTTAWEVIELSEDQESLLESEEAKAWFMIRPVSAAPKPAKKVEKKADKKED